ncbi:hypothetical protein Fmac_015554 [Flemingia macrophylla]|uniref:Uncharacterized protein n=1 Tax=Flemingia macrophylla TaxID=520843 RepID=A0ABD1MEZ7_9FABA
MISVLFVSPGIVQTNVARDLPKLVQAAYRLIPSFLVLKKFKFIWNDVSEWLVIHVYLSDVEMHDI